MKISKFHIMLRIATIIALCELAIMIVFVWAEPANPWVGAVVDCLALTVLSAPLLYWWVGRAFNDELVTENRRLNDQAAFQAGHDEVTGLINRDAFMRQMAQACESVKPNEASHTFCFIDLDYFSLFSNSCGPEAADRLLRDVAQALRQHIRATDLIVIGGDVDGAETEMLARVGDDRFGLLLYHCPQERAEDIANRLIAAVHDVHIPFDRGIFKAGCSIGITTIASGNLGCTAALREASSACCTAKDLGRRRFHVYRNGDTAVATRHEEIDWVAQIQSAITNDRFVLYQQPITPLLRDHDDGDRFEVLLRLDNGEGPPSLPGHMMAAAERYSLAPLIDRWVITRTFATLDRLYGSGTGARLECCAINLSGATMAEEWLPALICEQFERYSIRPDQICFEITETHAIANPEMASRLIGQLRNLGCRLALDDFGSGLSSFPYLKKYPVDYLKIDGSLVKDITNNHLDRVMVEAINMMAHAMGLKTVAEWVEDEETLAVLMDIGVNFGQGFLLARPTPLGTAIEKARLEWRGEEARHALEPANARPLAKQAKTERVYHRVSHELKTPLTAAMEFANLMAEELLGALTDEQREALEVIRNSHRQLATTIDDLLDGSRLENGELALHREYLSVGELVQSVVTDLMPSSENAGITLTVEVGEGPSRAMVDAARIRQVIANLVENALKFTPAGGRVKVSVSGDAGAGTVRIGVTDTGQGIPQNELSTLFDRFHQTETVRNQAKGGLGLGLSICRGLVKLHEGKFEVESVLGQGSTFSFSLPLAPVMDNSEMIHA